jgi:hypothetical protein
MIDTYISIDKFILKKGDKTYAAVMFKDLKLLQMGPGPDGRRDLDADECWELDHFLEQYQPGQIIKNSAKQEVVLGPERAFTHEVTLHACGNPDFRQYADLGPKIVVRVCGIEEAQAAVKTYQRRYEMGGGNCAKDHGIVWALPAKPGGQRKKVGEVTYNYRYWTVADKAAWEKELKEKYATPAH